MYGLGFAKSRRGSEFPTLASIVVTVAAAPHSFAASSAAFRSRLARASLALGSPGSAASVSQPLCLARVVAQAVIALVIGIGEDEHRRVEPTAAARRSVRTPSVSSFGTPLPKSCAVQHHAEAFPPSAALRINSVASGPVEMKASASMASLLPCAASCLSSGFACSFLRPAI